MKKYHLCQNQAEIIDHTCDDNVISLLNTEEEADVTSIKYINANNYISINDDENFSHKYYSPFLLLKKNEDISL